MRLTIAMLDLIPKALRDRMRTGAAHPTIAVTLTSMLICGRNCVTCPLYDQCSR